MSEKIDKIVLMGSVGLALIFAVVVILLRGGDKGGRMAAEISENDVAVNESVSDNSEIPVDADRRLVLKLDLDKNEENERKISEAKTELINRNVYAVWDGDIDKANSIRADAYMEFRVTDRSSVSSNSVKGTKSVIIEYNDDYYIPEFDSFDMSVRLCNAYEAYGYSAEAVYADDERLRDAMQPAVRLIFINNDDFLPLPAVRAIAGEL